MRLSMRTRWILAFLLLAIAAQALVFAPQLHNMAVLFWGLSFAFLICALVVAVRRRRESRSIDRSTSRK